MYPVVIFATGCINSGANNVGSPANISSHAKNINPQNMPTTNQKKLQGTAANVLQVGGNYFTQTNYPVGGMACLDINSDNIKFVNPSAIVDFSLANASSDLQRYLSVDVSSKVGWGVFSASLATQYAQAQQDTNYDLNFNYVFKYAATALVDLNHDKTGINLLSSSGEQHFKNGVKDFSENCGDSFVSQADAGATLVVTYNIHFNNQLDKNNFELALNAQYELASISTQIQNALKNSHTRATINLKAIQLGGNPVLLQGVFGNASPNGYAIMNCSSENLAACSQVINKIIDYAHAQGDYTITGLEHQIQLGANSKPVNPSAFYYSNPVATKWQQINADPGFIYPTTEVIMAQGQMVDWYHLDEKNLNFISNYIIFLRSIKTDPKTMQLLENIQTNLKSRLSQYANLDLSTCFQPGVNAECIAKYNTMNAIRTTEYPINNDIMDYFSTAYYVKGIYEDGHVNTEYDVPITFNRHYGVFHIDNGTYYGDYYYRNVELINDTLAFTGYNNGIKVAKGILDKKKDPIAGVYYEGDQTSVDGKTVIDLHQWYSVNNPL